MKRVYLLLLALLVLLGVPFSAEASSFGDRVEGLMEVTGVRVSSSQDRTRIVVDAKVPLAALLEAEACDDPGAQAEHFAAPDIETDIGIGASGAVGLRHIGERKQRRVGQRHGFRPFHLIGLDARLGQWSLLGCGR